MATQNKIVRTVEATTETELSKATFNGWDLNFSINKTGGVLQSINVNGNKDNSNVSASYNKDGYTQVGFLGDRDNDLYTALMDEIDAIKAEGE